MNISRTYLNLLSAALLLLIFACGSTPAEEASAEVPQVEDTHRNVILIIIDTLRSDHLSCYGYERYTTPVLDSLASTGTLWKNAYSQAPWTLPSHATIWTGMTPRTHMTRADDSWHYTGGPRLSFALDPSLPVLPQLLLDEGFSTCGIANVFLLGEEFGFNRGFQSYSCAEQGYSRVAASVDSLIMWIDSNREERFFCMLHIFDVHNPYYPPDAYRTLFEIESSSESDFWIVENGEILNPQDREHLIALYDGEIAWVDDNLRRFFGFLRDTGLNENTLIIVTSDHGEEFLDHGWVHHGSSLYQELLHIPLIMSGPGIPEGTVDEDSPVGLLDLMPTILAWTGSPCPETVQGIDILGGDVPRNRILPASGVTVTRPDSLHHLASVLVLDQKTIGFEGLELFQSFNLTQDSMEMNPLEADSLSVEMVLQYWASPQQGDPEMVDSDHAAEHLRDLGYID